MQSWNCLGGVFNPNQRGKRIWRISCLMQVLSPFQTFCWATYSNTLDTQCLRQLPEFPLLCSQVYATQTATRHQPPSSSHSYMGSSTEKSCRCSPFEALEISSTYISGENKHRSNKKTSFLACQDLSRKVKPLIHFSRWTIVSAVFTTPHLLPSPLATFWDCPGF